MHNNLVAGSIGYLGSAFFSCYSSGNSILNFVTN